MFSIQYIPNDIYIVSSQCYLFVVIKLKSLKHFSASLEFIQDSLEFVPDWSEFVPDWLEFVQSLSGV